MFNISKDTILISLFVNVIQAEVFCGEEMSIGKMPLPEWPVGKYVGTFSLLIIDVGGTSPLWDMCKLYKKVR